MIKFTASGEGRILIGFGLESGNLSRLQAGQPIRVALSELGFHGEIGRVEILLFAGESHEALRRMVEPMISSDTVVHDEIAVGQRERQSGERE